MFDNIGGKLKTLAIITFWIGIIGSIVGAIALWSANSYYTPTTGLGFVVLIAGCLLSYLSSMGLYAFGELVETSCEQTELAQQNAKAQAELAAKLQQLLESRPTPASAPMAGGTDDVASHLLDL